MNPSVLLQATLKVFAAAALLISAVSVLVGRLTLQSPEEWRAEDVQRDLSAAWVAYREVFIGPRGQLKRPRDHYDTVAEGQANAMVRAVWLDDRETFNLLYLWTEQNLSRLARFGDHLLSHKMGPDSAGAYVVVELNAPVDANLDYALALFLAHRRWGAQAGHPPALMPYRDKALAVASDILRKGVIEHPRTRELVLLPWCRAEMANEPSILLCPADFSPGHYRLFYNETNDPKWMRLLDSTYAQLSRLLQSIDRREGAGLAPDWVRMREDGGFQFDGTYGMTSGVESFRLWWRLRLDLHLAGNAGDPRARRIIEERLSPFIPRVLGVSPGILAAKYSYEGRPEAEYENPGALGALAWALDEFDGGAASASMELHNRLVREYMNKEANSGDIYFGGQKDDYYINTWAWWGLAQEKWAFPFASLPPPPPAGIAQGAN